MAESMKALRDPGNRTISEKTLPPRSHPPTEMYVFRVDFFCFRAVNFSQ